MGNRRKQLTMFCALGAAWCCLLFWQWRTWEAPTRVPLANVSGPAASPSRTGGDHLHVQLDLMASARTQRQMTFATPRNIFALPSPGTIAASAQVPVSDTAMVQQAVATDLAQFHYLGFVRTGEDWQKKQQLAVLTKNDDLHVVKTGEIIDKQVLVKAIHPESVTLVDRKSRLEYTVLLSDEPEAAPAP